MNPISKFYEKVLNHLVNYYGDRFSDEAFVRMRFRTIFHYNLNLRNPRSFNERMQWLKFHDRKPVYHEMADKYGARAHIAQRVGEQYLMPLLGVWDRPEDIPFDELPEEFVLKCTHDSNSIVLCHDKQALDVEQAREQLRQALAVNYQSFGREWVYKDITPRIIGERLLVDESGDDLKDYKIWCFHGEPKIIQIDYDRFRGHKRRLFDLDWNEMPVHITYPDDRGRVLNRPRCLDEMLEVCRRLSADMAFLRVDLYVTKDAMYVGELTFYPGGGFEPIEPLQVDYEWGQWLDLSKVEQNT